MILSPKAVLIITLSFAIHLADAQSTRKKTTTPAPAPKTETTTPVKVDSVKKAEPVIEEEPESDKPLRKEFESKKSSSKYNIIPTGKSGVSIFFQSEDKKNGMDEWNWIQYNNQFEEISSKTFLINTKLGFADYTYDETTDHIFLFFGKPDNAPSLPAVNGYKDKFEVIDLDVNSKSIATIEGVFAKKMHLNTLKAINGNLYIGGSVVPTTGQLRSAACVTMLTCFIGGKRRFDVFPYLVKVTKSGAEEVKVPIQKQGEILSIEYDSTSKKILCTASDAPMPTDRNIMIFELGEKSGSKPIVLKSNANYYLLNGQSQNLNDKDRLIIGSYAKRDQKDKLLFGIQRKAKNTMPASTGLYVAKIINNKQSIDYYPFSKFTDIAAAINTAAKGKEKRVVKMTEGLNYNILLHKIIKRGDQYVLIGDIYYAVYHTETYQSMGANGKMTTSTRTVFDGWNFTKSLIAGFDLEGNMKWTNSFDLEDRLSPSLREQVKVLQNPANDKIVLVYSYGGVIKSQVLDGETLEEQNSAVKLYTANEQDKVKTSKFSNVAWWYGNYFIAYGYQDIEGKNQKGKKDKRTVFYMNKVSYR